MGKFYNIEVEFVVGFTALREERGFTAVAGVIDRGHDSLLKVSEKAFGFLSCWNAIALTRHPQKGWGGVCV